MPEESATDAGVSARASVLVAEDDAELRDLLRSALESAGFRVNAVADGEAMRQELRSNRKDVRVVVSDIMMPHLTGLSVLEILRRDDERLPVIFLSSFVDEAVLARAYRLGATVVLKKPCDLDTLLSVVRSVVPDDEMDGAMIGTSSFLSGKTILLGEDDDELRQLLYETLVERGAKVVSCRHGLQLVEELDRAFGEQGDRSIDLVLTDVRMPGVTGISALEGLKAIDDSCPVILMTAFPDENVHAEAKRLRADSVFDKPFDIDLLVERIRNILSP